MKELLSSMDLGTVLTVLLAGITTFIGVFWKKAKVKIGQLVSLGKELYQAGDVFEKALQDDKITKDEIESIKKEFQDVKDKFKALINKK